MLIFAVGIMEGYMYSSGRYRLLSAYYLSTNPSVVPSIVGPVAASRSPFSVYVRWKTFVQAFLNRDDVREAIHAESCPIAFKECTDPPFIHLAK